MGDDSAASYVHPDFTVTPTFCPVAYEYSVTPLNDNESAIDISGQQFSFFYDESLGDHVGRQTVTVTARTDSIYPTASTESLSGEADFTLSILVCIEFPLVENKGFYLTLSITGPH